MAGGHASIFPAYGQGPRRTAAGGIAAAFRRELRTGEYGWTTDLETIKRSVDWQLTNLQTDYIDFGFIHCLDEEADLAAYERAARCGTSWI